MLYWNCKIRCWRQTSDNGISGSLCVVVYVHVFEHVVCLMVSLTKIIVEVVGIFVLKIFKIMFSKFEYFIELHGFTTGVDYGMQLRKEYGIIQWENVGYVSNITIF